MLKRPVAVLVQEKCELAFAQQLACEVEEEVILEVVDLERLRTPEDWVGLFSTFFLCVSGRLRQALASAALEVPTVLALPRLACSHDERHRHLAELGVPVVLLDESNICRIEKLAYHPDSAILEKAQTRLMDALSQVLPVCMVRPIVNRGWP